jgi:hypothetical protein
MIEGGADAIDCLSSCFGQISSIDPDPIRKPKGSTSFFIPNPCCGIVVAEWHRNRGFMIGPSLYARFRPSPREQVRRSMAQYYFHIHNSHGSAEDDEGVEAASLSEAKEKAIAGIRSLLSAEVENGKMNMKGRIDIADGSGKILLSVQFRESLTISGL